MWKKSIDKLTQRNVSIIGYLGVFVIIELTTPNAYSGQMFTIVASALLIQNVIRGKRFIQSNMNLTQAEEEHIKLLREINIKYGRIPCVIYFQDSKIHRIEYQDPTISLKIKKEV